MTDITAALEDARLSSDETSDATIAEREAARAARRMAGIASAAPLPGAPLDAPCPHCGGSGVLRQISRQERMRLNDAFLRNRRPGDPLPPRNGPAPPAAVMQVHSGGEAELRNLSDAILDRIETDGYLAPVRTSPVGWTDDSGAGTPIV